MACVHDHEKDHDAIGSMLSRAKELKLDMMLPDHQNRTPLHYACLLGKTQNAKTILEYAKNNEININIRDSYGRTPYQCADLNFRKETMEMMIKMSEDMDLDVRPSTRFQYLKKLARVHFFGNDYS